KPADAKPADAKPADAKPAEPASGAEPVTSDPAPASSGAAAQKEAAPPAAGKAAPPRKPARPVPPKAVPGRPAPAAPRAPGRPTAPTTPDGAAARKLAPAPVAVNAAPESAREVEAAPSSGLMTHTPTPTGPQGLLRTRGRAASAVDRLGPGSTLGRYEILMPVAKGGMAAVWAARLQGTRGFQKIVAVKTMLPDVSDDPDFQTMFLDEARVAARIRHPNVAEILDLGEEEDVLYLVMEWVDGETLSTLQKASKPLGGIPQRIALRIASQICAGLHNAHELRDDHGALLDLVHRDVSPANVLVSTAGFVKIVDFGVAKSKGRLHVTRAGGVVKGKTPYLSPEQLGGLPIDRRSDIFSLGALLYVLTTGLHPFRGETEMATVENIALKNPMAPRELNEAIHPEFEKVIQKALEKDRSMRYSTCAEMQRALDQVASLLGEPTTDEDVADFVREAIGSIQAKRAQDLRDAIATVDAGAAVISEPRPAGGAPAPAAEEPAAAQEAAQPTPARAPAAEAGASGATSSPGFKNAPMISSSDLVDEVSFEEVVAPTRDVAHPPKLIIAPSAQPPPAPEAASADAAPEAAAAAPAIDVAVDIGADAAAPLAEAGPLLEPGAPDADQRKKRMQRIVIGAVGAAAVLGAIALFAGGGSSPPDRAGTTSQTTTSVAETPPAPPPTEPPPQTTAAAPSAPDPLAEPPPTPPGGTAEAQPPPADTTEPQPPATAPPPPTAKAPATAKPPTTRTPPPRSTTPPKTTPTKPPPKKTYDPTRI
ncbi:MAG: serine/threonine protein kinase, partial [Polyangiaceae bacterium]|nr:serine/threonine protein kinase [Polyangiaceae bacterium]